CACCANPCTWTHGPHASCRRERSPAAQVYGGSTTRRSRRRDPAERLPTGTAAFPRDFTSTSAPAPAPCACADPCARSSATRRSRRRHLLAPVPAPLDTPRSCLLARLPEALSARLAPELRPVPLATGQVLMGTGGAAGAGHAHTVYFVRSGLVSV